MEVKEKLVEIIQISVGGCARNWAEIIADGLIAHGVTVGGATDNNVGCKWISVKDRLPERTLPPKDVLVYHDLGCGMFIDRAWYSYEKQRWRSVLGMKLKVTHWMPLSDLPQPQKGE